MTKSLSKAIALATLVGVSASAHAVNVNQDGLGEVLLYSLYTAEEGNVTNINITNTTGKAKAVKVRFLEGQNSQEVLDFNLYLSAHDQWSGAVTQTADGAKLITADKSCTAPAIPAAGVDFLSHQYKGDGGSDAQSRTRVGHIEVIEMGVLGEELAAYVTADHTQAGSAPANCNALRAEFSKSATWGGVNINEGFEDGSDVALNGWSGGLYGSASILNIEGSTQIAYDALAIENFMVDDLEAELADQEINPNHATTGTVKPSLIDGGNAHAFFKNGKDAYYVDSGQAISALLMKEGISNDFVLDEGRGSETNWVITFPTKRLHVYQSSSETLPPFTTPWTGKSCHLVSLESWDNEEFEGPAGDLQFSPALPGETSSLCYETNILTFNGGKVLGGEHVSYNVDLDQPDFRFGWMHVGFNGYSLLETVAQTVGSEPGTFEPGSAEALVVKGLPVIGFSAVTIKNNKANNGVMNNYGSATSHKANTSSYNDVVEVSWEEDGVITQQ